MVWKVGILGLVWLLGVWVAGADVRDSARAGLRAFGAQDFVSAADTLEGAGRVAGEPLRSGIWFDAALARACAGWEGKGAEGTNQLQLALADLGMLSGESAVRGRGLDLEAGVRWRLANSGAVPDLAGIEAAASAAREAWAVSPEDGRLMGNYLRVASGLPGLRRKAFLRGALEREQGTAPDQLADRFLGLVRGAGVRAEGLYTNAPGALIALSEGLAGEVREGAGMLYALRQKVFENPQVTNESVRAVASKVFGDLDAGLERAACLLEDLDPESLGVVSGLEAGAYPIWQAVASPPSLVGEDVLVQSNALLRARSVSRNRPDQEAAAELTKLFIERFPAWAEQAAQSRAAQTNLPPFTLEDRNRIRQLAAETLPLQTHPTAENQAKALANLLEIQRLLPKDPSNDSPQPNPQSTPQPNPSGESKQPPPEQGSNQPPQKEPTSDPQSKQPPPSETDNLLRQALEREREHRDAKRQRARPASPASRDW